MQTFRRRLAGLVCLGLLWQAGAYAAATSIAAAGARDRQDVPDCCKLHGPHDVCPMEMARRARRSAGAPGLSDPCCSPDTALLTLLGTVGLPAARPRPIGSAPSAASDPWCATSVEDHIPFPHVPPPRR